MTEAAAPDTLDEEEYLEEEDLPLDPKHEGLAEYLTEGFKTPLDRAEEALNLSESAEDEEEEKLLVNLGKFYAALAAASRPNSTKGDSISFAAVYDKLKDTPVVGIARRVMALEDSLEKNQAAEADTTGEGI